MKIKLISFDFWSTIYHNIPSLSDKQKYVILQLLKRSSINDIEEIDINNAAHSAWVKWDMLWKEKHITLNVKEWLALVLDYLHVEIEDNYVLDCCSDLQSLLFTGNTKEIPGVRTVIESLSKSYSLSIISDTGLESGEYIRKLLRNDNIDYFDYCVFSDEFGRSKPHSSVFRALLTYFNLNPEEVVHIGDSRRTDVAGAKSVGINTIRFSGCSNDENSKFDEADIVMNDYYQLPEIIENFTKLKKEPNV